MSRNHNHTLAIPKQVRSWSLVNPQLLHPNFQTLQFVTFRLCRLTLEVGGGCFEALLNKLEFALNLH